MVQHTNTKGTSLLGEDGELKRRPSSASGRPVRTARLVSVVVLSALSLGAVSALSSPALAAECPNEAIRKEQHVTETLPDCRAYERVSPEEKGNGDVVADGDTTQSSADGDAAVWDSRSGFGEEIGAGQTGHTQYLSRRGPDGWTTHAITPTGRPDAIQTIYTGTRLGVYSSDLSTATVLGYDLPGGESVPNRMDYYSEDTATRALSPITGAPLEEMPPAEFLGFPYPYVWGASSDARHLAFVANTRFTAEAAAGFPNVYEWNEGVVSLAGILPDGMVPPEGSNIEAPNYRGNMSSDGNRLLFDAAPNGAQQLYMRIDGNRTVWISQPEGSDQSEPSEVRLEGMTPDGHTVFFTTSSKLLDEDTNEGPDLYRWTEGPDPAHDLKLISHTGEVGRTGIGTVVGMSEDGERVYYDSSNAQLTVWDKGSSTVIATVENGTGNYGGESLAVNAFAPGFARVSPDGMWMAFGSNSTAQNDSVHALTGQVTNGHREIYLYSLKDKSLTCVSCPAGGATSNASLLPEVTLATVFFYDEAIRPNFLADNGAVVFSTAEALVPQDVNGVADVYEYDPASGKPRLISTGRGKDPAGFADASADGKNVFILTRQPLIASDHDQLVDLYDARVGGGFPEPSSASTPCVDDVCQGALAPPPPPGSAPTIGFVGPGNTVPAAGVPTHRAAVSSQTLTRAVRACRTKRNRAKRRRCEAAARTRFGKSATKGR
jgi:hypothetical protein